MEIWVQMKTNYSAQTEQNWGVTDQSNNSNQITTLDWERETAGVSLENSLKPNSYTSFPFYKVCVMPQKISMTLKWVIPEEKREKKCMLFGLSLSVIKSWLSEEENRCCISHRLKLSRLCWTVYVLEWAVSGCGCVWGGWLYVCAFARCFSPFAMELICAYVYGSVWCAHVKHPCTCAGSLNKIVPLNQSQARIRTVYVRIHLKFHFAQIHAKRCLQVSHTQPPSSAVTPNLS